MKKIKSALLALGGLAVTVGLMSCGSKKQADNEAESADSIIEMTETPAPGEGTDSLAAIFANPDKMSAEPTDSTYAVTASGLKYMIIREGSGQSPRPSDSVTVNYRGQLLDGQVFDSSYDHGQPLTFPLTRVIPGWTEGLQLMKPGGEAVFYIPSNLAYGSTGTPGGPIGPDQDLIFTVELISVN